MAEHPIPLADWSRAPQFRLFRGYDRPHYALTTRLDVTHLMARRVAAGLSPYRACLFAIGCGLHAVPALLMRFRGDQVLRHDRTDLSMTVPLQSGDFTYAYVPFAPDFPVFEAEAMRRIEAARTQQGLEANSGARDDVAYLSCLPWLDFTALDNALPHADDCIPRVSWGKIVPEGDRYRMAMAIQVHHALVDGAHLGQFFDQLQRCLDGL
ncbi:CatA-like O-acetyltransferase [Tropicibacter oceani]|uniref:CatA-like O-acetyltransferase n=1 Tax=Tropicibacter oceani TaxID=3058420 RepID=A0ABY8QEG4_9RHOB|nr:CatA-like O-acetyltransferase [Tropicibacter oceani]WGW02431.1 CatA-like O-acetyltransferase [Tropicibacter oceani]